MSIATKSILFLIVGLIIRVHQDYIVMSIFAWASFIFAIVALENKIGLQWRKFDIRSAEANVLFMSLFYNAYFHVHIINGWPGI